MMTDAGDIPPQTPTDAAPQRLAALREEIDRLDNQIHDLLMRRAEIVAEVGSAKRGANPTFLRPAREAEILRRLVARHQGSLPFGTVARIWREIVGGMTMIQGKFGIAVYLPEGDGTYWDLARDQFGVLPSVTVHLSAGSVLRAVSDDPAMLGVLPWPQEGDSDPWWQYVQQADDHTPRIVARLPAYGAANGPSALVIARAPLEASGEDRSFLVVETLKEISRTRLLSRVGAAGFTVDWITDQLDKPGLPGLHLIEVEGFVTETDPRLLALHRDNPEEIGQPRVIGGYPMPLRRK
ncbi:MAG: chorismate mutase [Elstera cyanobacteriorum]|nr:chorismate mutase [Elstera cyanobacteriorum]